MVTFQALLDVCYIILSIFWIVLSVKESNSMKAKTDVDDNYKKDYLKTRKVTIVLWSICLAAAAAALVCEITGWGDIPVF